jgi:N-methylhydantoinase A/oxoprolinase/acetone carboxylase beta subunit
MQDGAIHRTLSVAVDIGGTFTDVVAADSALGRTYVAKVPTTPGRLVDGVRDGILHVLAEAEKGPGDVQRIVHGTTVATNAVLERRGARTGVLATEGFEDVLEIGRLRRTRIYDLDIDPETPVFLAPRRRRRGVRERVGADGEVVVALDEAQAREAIGELVRGERVEALAVVFLHSYRNAGHERRVGELVRELAPDVGVSLSSEVDPTFREYERTVVTAFDAYLRPVVGGYLAELGAELERMGVEAPLQVMQSRGGIASAKLVARRPVSVLLSGPAAGATGGAFAAARSGFASVVTMDVGGTSADVSLVEGGRPQLSSEGSIDGYPLRVPMVDLSTIGAGGGSIAWLDRGGGFRVGPRSAGAEPGPACYGRGGSEPTVTDASLVLGYLDPGSFAGGVLRLDPDRAAAALAALGAKLGLSPVEAAAGVHRVVNAKMADEIRLLAARRGQDPRDLALVVLGGAGPIHGGRVAAELAAAAVLVPGLPGVLSAFGLLVSNVEHERAETVAAPAALADPAALEAELVRLEAEVAGLMAQERVPEGAARTSRSADMRYVGQSYTLEVPLLGTLDSSELAGVVARFHDGHRRVYGHATPDKEAELVNLRVAQSWALPLPELAPVAEPAGAGRPRSRPAFFEELGGFVETPVLQRGDLGRGEALQGPAIVEQPDTTIVLYPGQRAAVDAAGNLLVTLAGEASRSGRKAVA